jgi:hypothetical protein
VKFIAGLAAPLAAVVTLAAVGVYAQAQEDTPRTPLPPQTPVVPYGEPGKSLLTVKDLMRHILNPAAETFWLASGEVDDGETSRQRAPTTDAKWNGTLAAAATVMESANLLMMDGRAVADPQWAKWSADLNKAGLAGIKAAEARDGDGVLIAGGDMFDACRACHVKYIPRQREEWAPLPEVPEATPKR